jgi:hypothetical protein
MSSLTLNTIKAIVAECIIDFCKNHIDQNSNDDIAIQVDRYIKEHFEIKDKNT